MALKSVAVVVAKVDTEDGYKAGDPVSYTTDLGTKIDETKYELIDLGMFEEGRIDFSTKEYNKLTKTLKDRPAVEDPVQTLLAVPKWSSDQTEQALRYMLRALYPTREV